MEVAYYEMDDDDEDEEDIPDEWTDTEEMIKIHDRIIPRGSITSNILTHSFIVEAPFSALSISNNSRRESNNVSNISRGIISNKSSFNTPNSGLSKRTEIRPQERSMNMINQHNSQTAIDNWSRMFRKIMLEYRRYRIRKAAQGEYSPSLKRKNTKSSKPTPAIRIQNGLKWYPCVRFIQRWMKLWLKRRTLRWSVPQK